MVSSIFRAGLKLSKVHTTLFFADTFLANVHAFERALVLIVNSPLFSHVRNKGQS